MKLLGVLGLVACLACGLDKEAQLQRRVDSGDIKAMMELAEANESLTGGGFIRKPNTQKSRELYRKAAALGHTPAMYALSQFLTDTITNEERVMWLKKGAELGNGACVTELINAYRQGLLGVPEDPVEAFRWVKVGWQMDFKERQYDAHRQSEEMERLLTTYRSHLRVSLKQKGISDAETRRLLEQIQ